MRPPEPMTTGSLLSRSWTIYREDFFGYTLVILMFKAPSLALTMLLADLGANGVEGLPILVAGMLLDLVLMPLAVAIAILGVYRGLRGPHLEFGEAFSLASSRWLAAVGGSLLVGLAVVIGFVFLIVPGVVVACGTVALIPSVVVEKLSVGSAWDRSWELTQGHRGAIFGGLASVILMSLVLGFVTAGVLGSPTAHKLSWLFPLLNGMVGVVIQTWTVVLTALIYHDLRHASGEYEQSDVAKVFA